MLLGKKNFTQEEIGDSRTDIYTLVEIIVDRTLLWCQR